jgi:hypothetical protein
MAGLPFRLAVELLELLREIEFQIGSGHRLWMRASVIMWCVGHLEAPGVILGTVARGSRERRSDRELSGDAPLEVV